MPSLQTAPAEDTKAALLESAERLFAEHGIDGASLRAITRDAGSNLASVHYHFGSKEALVKAVLARRLAPLNRERLELLDACPRDDTGRPTLEGVLRAFIAPPLHMIRSEHGGHAFARFVLRSFSEPNPALRRLVVEQFESTVERFVAALAEALPRLPLEEVHWRFHFTAGSMVHTAALGSVVEEMSCGLCDPLDVEAVIERLVAFCAQGMSAPVAAAGSRS